MDLVLTNGGEVTNGNSPYETQVLDFLNQVNFSLIAGGTITFNKDTTIEIDEAWPWARAERPIIIELQPKYESGTISLTQGSEAGTLSEASAASLYGWHIRIDGRNEWFRIAAHSAGGTAIELDGAYTDATGSALGFEARKIDYELVPSYLTIDTSNNKFDFKKTAGGSLLTATLTSGVYTPAQLATHVASVVTTAASGPTITGSYSAITRLFTFVSDGAGATVFQPFFATGTNQGQSVHKVMGYDDTDYSGALTYTGTYVLGGIARLIEPMRVYKANEGSIYGIDNESFQRNYPLIMIEEGQPDRFTIIREASDGTLTVRFNRYPAEKTRVELEHIPVPRDLKDNAGSISPVPRKHVEVLKNAATAYLMMLKSDDRMQNYVALTQGKLASMISQYRGSLVRSGVNFGELIPRRDQIQRGRRRLFPTEPY